MSLKISVLNFCCLIVIVEALKTKINVKVPHLP